MLDAFQGDRIGSPVDPADGAPITLPHPDPVLVAAQRSRRGIRRKRRGGKGFRAPIMGAALVRRERWIVPCTETVIPGWQTRAWTTLAAPRASFPPGGLV